MRLLDTPAWGSLTTAERNHINNISGNDIGDGFTTTFTPAAARTIDSLAERGLITVTWHEGNNSRRLQATLRLREEGWK